MKGLYKYHCRPGYRTGKLMIEFISGVERSSFGDDLLDALKGINPKIGEKKDLWMNDEVVYEVDSNKGPFKLSIDNWGLGFIMAEDNQDCISIIDKQLVEDERFERIAVDHEKYRAT